MSEKDQLRTFRVWCEDCGLDKTFDESDPPEREIEYWGSKNAAQRNWSAESAAKGRYDNHRMSEFRDYDQGLRHRVHLEEISGTDDENNGMIDSIPHPLTPETADRIEESSKIRELHTEVVSSRLSGGAIVPAFLLTTDNVVCAVVEADSKDSYRVLAKGEPSKEDAVYSQLKDWCDRAGYR